MTIKPFNTLVLVERVEEDKKVGSLFLPEKNGGIFVTLKVLAVGDLVQKVKVGMLVHAHDLLEPIEQGSKIGYITENHIFGEIINES